LISVEVGTNFSIEVMISHWTTSSGTGTNDFIPKKQNYVLK